MQHVLVQDLADLAALEADWADLLARSARDFLPFTHFWTVNWWKIFGAGRQPRIHCLYVGKKLIAVSAMFLEAFRYRGVTVQRLTSMANGHSPYWDVIFDRDTSPGQVKEFVEIIVASAAVDLTVFTRVPDDSLVIKQLRTRSRLGQRAVELRGGFSTPVIRIDSDWDCFFGKRSQKFRKNLRNKVNRFNKTDGCRIERTQVLSSTDPVIDEMVAISRNSWKGRIGTDLGTAPGGRAFIAGLIDRLGPAGGTQVWVARCGQQAIAYEFHAGYNGVTYPLRADFAESHRDLAPGSVVEFTALRDLFSDRTWNLYDSCANNYWYLSNWTAECRAHFDIEIFENRLKPRLLHSVEYRLLPMLRYFRNALKEQSPTGAPPSSNH